MEEGRGGEGESGVRAHLLRTAGEMSVRGAKNVCDRDRGRFFVASIPSVVRSGQ